MIDPFTGVDLCEKRLSKVPWNCIGLLRKKKEGY